MVRNVRRRPLALPNADGSRSRGSGRRSEHATDSWYRDSGVRSAYRFELLKLIEVDILRPYGLAHDEFIRKGKRLLGEVRFNHVMDQVVAADLGIEILVAGLDAMGQTQLFSVSSRGLVTPAALPYHAIGAGAPVALGTLYP